MINGAENICRYDKKLNNKIKKKEEIYTRKFFLFNVSDNVLF